MERRLEKFLQELNSKFVYVSDTENYGFKEYWTELPPSYRGDCEDYALTIRKEFGGDLYYCIYKGQGHCILKLPDGTWIDNIYKKPVKILSAHYHVKYKYYWFIIAWKRFQVLVQKKLNIKLP